MAKKIKKDVVGKKCKAYKDPSPEECHNAAKVLGSRGGHKLHGTKQKYSKKAASQAAFELNYVRHAGTKKRKK